MSQNLLRFAVISVYSYTYNNARCSKSMCGKLCLRVQSTPIIISYKLLSTLCYNYIIIYTYLEYCNLF